VFRKECRFDSDHPHQSALRRTIEPHAARHTFITAYERRLDQPTLVGGLHYQYVQT
jgi:hypothetical protein